MRPTRPPCIFEHTPNSIVCEFGLSIGIEVGTDQIDSPASSLTWFYTAGHRFSLATFRPTGLITCERLWYTDIWVEMADSRFGDALLPDGRDIYIFMLISNFFCAPFHRHLAAIV